MSRRRGRSSKRCRTAVETASDICIGPSVRGMVGIAVVVCQGCTAGRIEDAATPPVAPGRSRPDAAADENSDDGGIAPTSRMGVPVSRREASSASVAQDAGQCVDDFVDRGHARRRRA